MMSDFSATEDLIKMIYDLKDRDITPSLITLGEKTYSQIKYENELRVYTNGIIHNTFHGIKMEVSGAKWLMIVK